MKKNEFQTPPADMRAVIFWSWNGMLEEGRLRGQIRQMKQAGIGGFFMHARAGNQTPYMQEPWFEMVRVCIDEARKQGMQAWLYDEDGYPSGYAGGAVPRLGKPYRSKALLALTEWRENDDEYRLLGQCDSRGLFFYEWTSPLGNPRFGGGSGVDLLNPDVVPAFIDSTHRKYAEQIGEEFGSIVPGIFSDEASLIMEKAGRPNVVPWTEGFEQRFRQTYGYDLPPRLVSLFHPEGEQWKQVRYDYWKLIVELLTNHYSKPIYEWCERHGLQFTGHYMGEDSLWKIMRNLGDPMPHYEYMHIPGLDYLGRQIHKTETEFCAAGGTVMTAKQVTSVAHQLNKPRVLSELFGGAGQRYDLRMQKWMIDWHLVHGVNMFTPHLLPYSMLGTAKRDWPPVIGPQQPWWKYAGKLYDYQARMSYALTRGKRAVPLLVIHPMESAWEQYVPSDLSAVEALHDRLSELCLRLLDAHIDFDFGSESIMERHGRVEEGGMTIGSSRYAGVVIPTCTRLRGHTAALLKQFQEQGGPVWSYEPAADLLERIPELACLPEIGEFRTEDIRRKLTPGFELDGTAARHVWVHERKDEEGSRWWFLSNLSLRHAVDTKLRIRSGGHGTLFRWNAETGEAEWLKADRVDADLVVPLSFHPQQAMLIEWRDEAGAFKEPEEPKPVSEAGAGSGAAELKAAQEMQPHPLNDFRVVAGDDNVLLLDWFQYLDESSGNWLEPELAHYIRLGGPGTEERAAERDAESTTRIRTTVRVAPGTPLPSVQLISEPGICKTVIWDGTMLEPARVQWLDPQYEGFLVPASLLSPGEHQLEVDVLPECPELENMYIRGSFKVRRLDAKRFELAAWDDRCDAADLVRSGYPFFSGSMTLRAVFDYDGPPSDRRDRRYIRCEDPQAAGITLRFNGHPLETRVWGPWEWDVTDWLAEGRNEAEFEAVGTLRNLFGPHYVADDESMQYLRRIVFLDQRHPETVLQPFGLGKVVLGR